MKKLSLLFFILFIVGGCSNTEDIVQITTKFENQLDEKQKVIQEQQIEIQELKEEIEAYKLIPDTDYRTSLQETDREARKIMRLIAEGEFEKLKTEYRVEFEIKDDVIVFGVPESNAPFSIELASNFMYIANFIKHKEGMEISYFISNPNYDRSDLIYMLFDNDMKFKYIFVGDA